MLKGVEWWDAGFLPNKTYDDIKDGHARIETEDDPLITHYIQHPVPIEPPNEAAHAASAKPRPLMLTTRERKRLRRQRRAELLKEKQDKIRLGLLPPDAPKVKLANMMRVLGQEAVLNPTEIEMKVRQQVADRLQGHLDHNAATKLSHEQRKAKESKKKEEDVAKGIYVSLYKYVYPWGFFSVYWDVILFLLHTFRAAKTETNHAKHSLCIFPPFCS